MFKIIIVISALSVLVQSVPLAPYPVPIHVVKRAAQNDAFGINTFQSMTPEWWSKQVGLDTFRSMTPEWWSKQVVPNLDFSAIVPQANFVKRYKRAAQNDAFGINTFQSMTPEWWSKQV